MSRAQFCAERPGRGARRRRGWLTLLYVGSATAFVRVGQHWKRAVRRPVVDEKLVGDPFEAALRRAAGVPPLHEACQRGAVADMRKLIEAGAAVDALDENARSALHDACERDDVDAARLLLESGASAMRADADGRYPLWYPCTSGNLAMVELLAHHGADLALAYMRAPPGLPLTIAADRGHHHIVAFLTEHTGSPRAGEEDEEQSGWGDDY
mmetsp:Transcript_15224/g.46168  ORF Transcript_15224/g.46168 Transcript_15224/m.46168 type:complete len:211 (-) Transcript_15224:38-670(-)